MASIKYKLWAYEKEYRIPTLENIIEEIIPEYYEIDTNDIWFFERWYYFNVKKMNIEFLTPEILFYNL